MTRSLLAQSAALGEMLRAAATGRPPPADGRVEVVARPPGPADAVVAFTAHHVVAAPVEEAEVLAQLPPAPDLSGPMRAPSLNWLGQRLDSAPGGVDLVMIAPAARAEAELELVGREDVLEHPRVVRAITLRNEIKVYGDRQGRGLVLLGRGLANRLELGIEVEPRFRGVGLGRQLLRAAVALAPDDEPLFAQVAPGNVASVRMLLADGFQPICAEVVFNRRRGNDAPGA